MIWLRDMTERSGFLTTSNGIHIRRAADIRTSTVAKDRLIIDAMLPG